MARTRSSMPALSSSRSIRSFFARAFMAPAFFSSAARYRIHIRFSPSSNRALASASLISPAATCLRRFIPMARTRSSMPALSSSRSVRSWTFAPSFEPACFMRSSRCCICSRVISPDLTISVISSTAASESTFDFPAFMAPEFFSSAARYRIHIRFSPSSNRALASASLISPAATCLRRFMPMARTRSSIFDLSSSRSTWFASTTPRSCATAVGSVVAMANVRPATASNVQAETARQSGLRGCGGLDPKRRETRCMSEPPVAVSNQGEVALSARSDSSTSNASAKVRGEPVTSTVPSSQQFSRSTRICRESHQVTG